MILQPSHAFQADNLDHSTYAEVILAGGDSDAQSAIASSDWRQAETIEKRPSKPRTTPMRPRAAPSPLHVGAAPASRTEERDRARAIVDVGKQAIIDTFAAAQSAAEIHTATLQPIVAAIEASIARDPTALPGVVRLKSRHEYTYLHSIAVCGHMIALANELRLDPCLIETIGLAGLLHDVGKALTPRMLLDKPGPLDDSEFAVVKRHPEIGAALLENSADIPDLVKEVCLYHHERNDGRGYPHRLPAEKQSIYVRMAAICDVYDAVTSVRAYKKSWSPGAAIEWMQSSRGHFDMRILAAFVRTLGAFPSGTLVRLDSDRLAIVLDRPDHDPLKPLVAVFYCATRRQPIPVRHVDVAHDPVLCLERSGDWNFPNWAEQRDMLVNSANGDASV